MIKRGRPKKMLENPYPKSQEASNLAWEHANNSKSKDDCPYLAEDDPELYAVWMGAFNKKAAPPRAAKATTGKAAESVNTKSESLPVEGNTLSTISTELLELELKSRKLKEGDELLKEELQLLDKLATVRKRITRLNVLVGE